MTTAVEDIDVGRMLTVRETAERLGVSEQWVCKHTELVGAVKLGPRLWRVPSGRIAEMTGGAA